MHAYRSPARAANPIGLAARGLLGSKANAKKRQNAQSGSRVLVGAGPCCFHAGMRVCICLRHPCRSYFFNGVSRTIVQRGAADGTSGHRNVQRLLANRIQFNCMAVITPFRWQRHRCWVSVPVASYARNWCASAFLCSAVCKHFAGRARLRVEKGRRPPLIFLACRDDRRILSEEAAWAHISNGLRDDVGDHFTVSTRIHILATETLPSA